MTPEYLEDLANAADPEQLWRTPALEQLDLPMSKRRQLDAGIALRRHASHVRRLNELLDTGKSLLITPLSLIGTATKTVPIPDSHLKLLMDRKKLGDVERCPCGYPQPCGRNVPITFCRAPIGA